MRMYDIISKKRDGLELSEGEINYFVEGYTRENIPDYQASALLMAIFLRGMNKNETVKLTKAMMHSGEIVDLSAIKGIKVDKHSTGGVGDTTTLVLAPLVASCGVPIAKMSGRGLGHTGGTIDKLESIKGFKTEMSIADFVNNVNRYKIAVIGQTKDVAPADKKIYALRDVTATVDNISLIASSIMSKKLAAGSDAIVLDVKVGSGAFMKDINNAIELANEMVEIGHEMGRNTIALVTDMDQPLGFAIGNALEVKEAISTLKGEGPEDLTKLCIYLGAYMVLLGKKAKTFEEAKETIINKLKSGLAFEKFKEFIKIQGGDAEVIENTELLPKAQYVYNFIAEEDGYIEHMKADDIGNASMKLGAGRLDLKTKIDLSAGIVLKKKVGDTVEKNEVIAELHTNKQSKVSEVQDVLKKAIKISKNPAKRQKLIKAIVKSDGIKRL
ncbi:MAG: pyrimidine-nucleoside phosphorylase [Candidatus Petromonas sp.]|jgi:pyrimidine-nucleoside phosphorylase|nr:pyrimidine-nucleoside phosphorylase [Candidatus Petromonas sp.]